MIIVALQDSQDPNPLIRALAVRTMGCIRVDKITEYLCDPLHRTLKVSDMIEIGEWLSNTAGQAFLSESLCHFHAYKFLLS
jgi:hypothetical protein